MPPGSRPTAAPMTHSPSRLAMVLRSRPPSAAAARTTLLLAGLLACAGAAALAQGAPAPGEDVQVRLRFIEQLYREDEGFRAESEVLRYLFDFPDEPHRPDVELLRAKLYYRDRKLERAGLMLYSLLDRYPGHEVRPPAARLLVFSLVRRQRLDDAQGLLPQAGLEPGSLDVLRETPPGLTPPEQAVAWSTWLPGAGFFALGEPGKGLAAAGLNLAFVGGTVLAYQGGNPGAALVFLLVEIALYRGGRDAVRDDALAQWRQAQRLRGEEWVRAHGEADLMRVGLTLTFGGS